MNPDDVGEDHPTWIVLVRDLSDLAEDGPTFVSLVLDAETGMARGVAIGRTASEARTSAMSSAASEPVAPFTNTPVPSEVVCAPGDAAALTKDLAAALGVGPLPPVRETPVPPEAEDILDELVAHLSGRTLPDELPTAERLGRVGRADPGVRPRGAVADLAGRPPIQGHGDERGQVRRRTWPR